MTGRTKNYSEVDNPPPRKQASKPFEADGWKGFVNVEIPEAQKDQVKSLRNKPDELWRVILDLVENGYKMSVTCDQKYSLYNLSLTCKNPKDVNNGYTLSGRGGTLLGAMASFVYKHATILEGAWADAGSKAPGAFDGDFVG